MFAAFAPKAALWRASRCSGAGSSRGAPTALPALVRDGRLGPLVLFSEASFGDGWRNSPAMLSSVGTPWVLARDKLRIQRAIANDHETEQR